MALSPGTHLGSYEVTALIGQGGMGEVPQGHEARRRRSVEDAATAHPKHQAMTRGLFLNVGKVYLDKNEVSYDVYQLK